MSKVTQGQNSLFDTVRNSPFLNCAELDKLERAIPSSPPLREDCAKSAQILLPVGADVARTQSSRRGDGETLADLLGHTKLKLERAIEVAEELFMEEIACKAVVAPYGRKRREYAEAMAAMIEDENAILTPGQRQLLRRAVAELDALRTSLRDDFIALALASSRAKAAQAEVRSLQSDIKLLTARIARKSK